MPKINTKMASAAKDQQQTPLKESSEIHGDVLETLLSHVPLVDLVFASRVSRSWNDAVFSSLRQFNKPKPWLVLHAQSTRQPYAITTRAYDPRSNTWIKLNRPSLNHMNNSTLKSSNSNFVYILSPNRFSFSIDPFNLNWIQSDPPIVWRNDPIVARVGDHVVIAGGGCDFVDDPLAVEIYSLKTGAWRTCDSMPGGIRDCSASLWLSIATSNDKLFVTEKETGLTHWFDPENQIWSDEIVLNPGQPVTSYNIGYFNDNLILFGVIGSENVEGVKVWRINVVGEGFGCEEMMIGEMPREFVENLNFLGDLSVNIRMVGSVAYVYGGTCEVVGCEVVDGGSGCRWWRVGSVAAREVMIANRLVYGCSEVGIEDLKRVEDRWSEV